MKPKLTSVQWQEMHIEDEIVQHVVSIIVAFLWKLETNSKVWKQSQHLFQVTPPSDQLGVEVLHCKSYPVTVFM